MSRSWLPGLLIAVALSAAAVAASAQQSVNFTSLDGATNLTAHLSRPEGAATGVGDDAGLLGSAQRQGSNPADLSGLDACAGGARLRRARGRQRYPARFRTDLLGEPEPDHDVARPAKGRLCRLAIFANKAVRAGRSHRADGLVAGRRGGAADHQRQEHRAPGGARARLQGRGFVLSRRLQRATAVTTFYAGRAAGLDHAGAAVAVVRRGRHLDAVRAVRGFCRGRQGTRQSGRTEELSIGGSWLRSARISAPRTSGP